HRREDAADTLDCIQVGMVERVVACDGRLTGAVRLPRSERAGGVDLAARNSIRELRSILPRSVWADIVQLDMFQLKDLRVFAWFGGPDDQPRVVTDDFVNEELDCTMTLTGSFRTLPPHFTGR